MRIIQPLTFLLNLILLTAASAQPDPYPAVPWQPLNNGADLAGWKVARYNGHSHFAASEGAILGTTVKGERISFLQTEKMYGNFILEWEFLVPDGMNAGVQLRSHCFPDYNEGRFHGYQFEMDGSPHSWCGGIFDEARRGWIGPILDRPQSENPFLYGDWNEGRVLALGNRIQTWLNGVPVTELHDSLTPAGYIALQLHDTRKHSGDEIRWRNFRIKDLDRALANASSDPFAGPWKGATSNAGKGIYARVARAQRDNTPTSASAYTAALYDNPDLAGPPVAELRGAARGQTLVFSGSEWSGRIENGVFAGTGRVRAVRLVNKDKIVEEIDKVISVSFVMMPGSFNLGR